MEQRGPRLRPRRRRITAGLAALNRLLSEGAPAELPVQDTDAFHMQILTTLVRYQPGLLGARLRAASARLLPHQAQSIALPDRSTR